MDVDLRHLPDDVDDALLVGLERRRQVVERAARGPGLRQLVLDARLGPVAGRALEARGLKGIPATVRVVVMNNKSFSPTIVGGVLKLVDGKYCAFLAKHCRLKGSLLIGRRVKANIREHARSKVGYVTSVALSVYNDEDEILAETKEGIAVKFGETTDFLDKGLSMQQREQLNEKVLSSADPILGLDPQARVKHGSPMKEVNFKAKFKCMVSRDGGLLQIAGSNPAIHCYFELDGLNLKTNAHYSEMIRLLEDNGFPNFEARLALGLGEPSSIGLLPPQRPIELGVSAVLGQVRTSIPNFNSVTIDRVVGDVWGLSLDMRWRFSQRYGMLCELFTGQGLGTYNAGVLQTVNLVSFDTVRTSGGFLELYAYLNPCLHTHVGYGIDDPLDSDLQTGVPGLERSRNSTFFANVLWDVNQTFRIGTELTLRDTSYLLPAIPDADGVGLHSQLQWTF